MFWVYPLLQSRVKTKNPSSKMVLPGPNFSVRPFMFSNNNSVSWFLHYSIHIYFRWHLIGTFDTLHLSKFLSVVTEPNFFFTTGMYQVASTFATGSRHWTPPLRHGLTPFFLFLLDFSRTESLENFISIQRTNGPINSYIYLFT